MTEKAIATAKAKSATLRNNLAKWADVARKSGRYAYNIGAGHIVSNFAMYTLAKYGEQKAEKVETDRRRAEHNKLRADLANLQQLSVKIGGRKANITRLGNVRFTKPDASGMPTKKTQSVTMQQDMTQSDKKEWITDLAAKNGLTVK
jgi:hypothetical protein